MTSLEDIVNQLFEEQPALSGDEAIAKLKEMKDPDTNKARWKTSTIRNRVETHLRHKETEKDAEGDTAQPPSSTADPTIPPATAEETGAGAATYEIDESKNPAVETRGAVPEELQLKTEGRQLSKKPADPFKPTPTSQEIDERLKSTVAEMATLKKDVLGLVGTLKNDMRNAITDAVSQLKQEVKQIAGTIPQYEAVQYTEIKLRQNTADALADYCSDNEFKESSEGIENLIASEEKYAKIKKSYQHLVELAKKSAKGTVLRVYSENEKVSFDELKRGQGISWKTVGISIAIGIGIGIAVVFIINLATGCLCPTDIPILPL